MYSMERSGLTGAPLVKNFYIRPCFRIYPLSMVAVPTAVALHLDSDIHGMAGFSRAGMVSTGRILSNLFLVQNVIKPGSIINVLWSLPYEVQMYVLLPVLFLWIRRSPLRRACLLWCASVLLARAGQPLLNAVGAACCGRKTVSPALCAEFRGRFDRLYPAARAASKICAMVTHYPCSGLDLRDLPGRADAVGRLPDAGLSYSLLFRDPHSVVALAE
jgi:hypothetical protein